MAGRVLLEIKSLCSKYLGLNPPLRLNSIYSARLLTKTYLPGNPPIDGYRSLAVRWRILKPNFGWIALRSRHISSVTFLNILLGN
jgi:hypothetical protein